MLSCVLLFATPFTVACQDPLSIEFSGQEYWSGLPFPIHLLHDGQVGLPCRERTLTLQLAGGLLFSLVPTDKPTRRMEADLCSHDAPCIRRDYS